MSNDRITRKEARVLAAAEFEKFAALAASLTPDEWATDTACLGWDVRKMVLHVLGSADAQASPRVFLHQLRRGLPLNKEIQSHHWVDGLNELQIRERSGLNGTEVVAQLQAVGTKAVKGRFGTPLPMRYTPVPFGEPIGWKPVNYLLEVASPATSGRTGSTSTQPSAVQWSWTPPMTNAWSPTSSPSGRSSTQNRSSCF
jgi:hypothetical protein